MAHDHTFDCRQCGAHLDSQEDLNKHMRDKHSSQAGSSNQGSSQGSSSFNSSSQRRKE